MKKLLLAALLITAFAFKADTPKTYKVEGDLQAFQALIDCLENSNEPHVKVEAVKKWIMPQLQKQVADTTKK